MKHKKWFWGILFILLAVFIVANTAGLFKDISLWTGIATILLIALIVLSVMNRNFFGVFLPVVFIYKIFQEPMEWPDINLWLLVLAAILASVGFSIIFKSYPKRPSKNAVRVSDDNVESFSDTNEYMDSNNPSAKVTFGASKKHLRGDTISSAQFYVSFGELEIHFDDAKLASDEVEVFLECSFGEIVLFIPKVWDVKNDLSTNIAGVVSNEERQSKPIDDAPKLKLVGNVQFGSIEIKYI